MLSKAETMKTVNKKYTEAMTLQEPVRTADGGGGYITVWTTRATVMAEFRKTSVSTEVVAGSVASDMTREIGIRYRTDIKKGWRALYGLRIFDVAHTYSYGHETTILVCREVVK